MPGHPEDMRRFRLAVVECAAGGDGAAEAEAVAQRLAVGVRTVVLVEGDSDRIALEVLAARYGRRLDAEGISVVPLGGATSIGRFLKMFGPQGIDVRLAGLCDAGEEDFFQQRLEAAGVGTARSRDEMEQLGFYVCVADLEDELIRALGAEEVQEVVEAQGELRSFRIFQKQPAQRERTVERQLLRFMGTHAGRKAHYARSLVEVLEPGQVPRPLDRLLAAI